MLIVGLHVYRSGFAVAPHCPAPALACMLATAGVVELELVVVELAFQATLPWLLGIYL
jgi:hypothetical protein